MSRIPDINYLDEYQRGYEAALHDLHDEFEKEHYSVATEDPYYAYYIKHVLNVIRKKINPLINYDE
jgi:hypothetical protein